MRRQTLPRLIRKMNVPLRGRLLDRHQPEEIHQRQQVPSPAHPHDIDVFRLVAVELPAALRGMVPGHQIRPERAPGLTLLPDHRREAEPEGGFQQVEVLLGGVELVPVHLHGRVEAQACLGAGLLDAAEAGGPKEQVQRLQVGMRSEPRPLQVQLQGPAQPPVQLADEFDRDRVMLSSGLPPRWQAGLISTCIIAGRLSADSAASQPTHGRAQLVPFQDSQGLRASC